MPRKPTGKPNGRPRKEFDKKTFQDLVGLGCSQEEICWYFRDETGKTANIDTLTRWCKREFGMTFQEYFKQNGCMALRMKVRKNQMRLSETSAAMAIFLGKNYLGQRDHTEVELNTNIDDTIKEMEAYFGEQTTNTGDAKR